MATYESLGVLPLINANGTMTALGGSKMPTQVLAAMEQASQHFVDMFELQRAVSEQIASLTRNEGALVVAGASAGLLVSSLAAMTGTDMRAVARLEEHGGDGLDHNEIIMHRAHRIPGDNVITLAGASIVEIGNVMETEMWELEGAITERTAALVYIAGSHLQEGALPLTDVTATLGPMGIPVIVDAAAQLPPRDNLWRYTEEGADMVLFSGGKELRGPQTSGLILGRRDWIDACAVHIGPLPRLARPAKVGKEEMVGLLTALEIWMEEDLDARLRRIEEVTAWWVDYFGDVPGVVVTREYPGESGRPLPRALLRWPAELGLSATKVSQLARTGDPGIDLAVAGPGSIWLSAEVLDPGEEALVATRIREILTSSDRPGPET
ncbi:MAG: hypothetical protein WEE53_05430 [Acidimicrobiia bacterium]